MTATHNLDSSPNASHVLYLALELSASQWKLAFTTARGRQPRLVAVQARDVERLFIEIERAKDRFHLSKDATVFSCHEAGRDGFWIHHALCQRGVTNIVVDSSSIEVNRRARRSKSDTLDAVSLVTQLVRYREGEVDVWSVVEVPDPVDEDQRHLHRELNQLKCERTAHGNRVRGLLATVGVKLAGKNVLPRDLDAITQYNGEPLPPGLKRQLRHEFERMELIMRQIKELETEQAKEIRDDQTRDVEKVRSLMRLKGVGQTTATILVREFFGWRRFANRREVAALAGLTPTPYQSGDTNNEQGISKSGNVWVRWIMVEVAWSWLRFQPDSDLTQWYYRRFGCGTSRMKRVGIVAVARKLLIAFWRYAEQGEVPAGSCEVEWEPKVQRVLGQKAA